ncbi:MAG: hypothetical protein WCJ29_00185 [bacterium]
MAIDVEGGALNPDEQMVFDHDLEDLKKASEALGLKGLEGRLKYGLDPAAMMVVGDTREEVERITKELGVSMMDVLPLIKKLHQEGPWGLASQLKAAEDPKIQTYLVLASICHESRAGYTPAEYIADRKRVVQELADFTPERFDEYKEKITRELKIESVAADGRVPIAEGDVALPLSALGYEGCVTKIKDMRFCQTSSIPDALLQNEGLSKGFAEVFNPAKDDFERVSLSDPNSAKGRVVWVKNEDIGKPEADMKPIVKRLYPGYVLAYNDEELAVRLVSEAIDAGKK